MDYSKLINKVFEYNRETKRIVSRRNNRYVLPAWLMFDTSDVPTGAFTVAAAGAATRPVGWKQPFTSLNGLDAGFGQPLEVKYLLLSDSSVGLSTANYEVSLLEMGMTRRFMNRACHVRTIFGDAKYPGRLKESFMFWSQHQVQAQFNAITGGARNIRAYLAGAQYYPWVPQPKESREKIVEYLGKWKKRQESVWPFWLTTDVPVTLAVGQEASFQMLVGQDAHFLASSIAAVSDGNFEWDLLEVKTGQQLSSGRITFNNSLGDARLPYVLPVPYLVPAGFRLRLTVKNLSGLSNRIFFTIQGRRINGPLVDVPRILCNTDVGEPQ
jgi:hypothetical protein